MFSTDRVLERIQSAGTRLYAGRANWLSLGAMAVVL
jgi:hypothetical protein